ncbi:MAG: hypothetical protein F2607_07535 [Actinobacteria bacterium]|jgi:hypothetical protein|uniref:Unannotated protein n=1 Tax=freshwater metagenome TaxID=449393 RepID=A0A6J6HGB3_9ZZZZ|nr:hypothetical protein [Actinomycetota bacterium]MSZ93787.1 hypothetical protein [Actinomycetota bacterium]
MTTDTPAPDDQENDRGTRTGVIIVVVAVVLGLILLTKGYGPGQSEVSPAGQSSSKTTVVVSTTTTLAANAPASVKVKVVNTTTVQGLATKTRDRLQTAGYTQVAVGDSPKPQEKTTVYYVAGSEADAQAVAKALGLTADQVLQMPDPPPAELAGATVLVMAGLDLR